MIETARFIHPVAQLEILALGLLCQLNKVEFVAEGSLLNVSRTVVVVVHLCIWI